MAPTATASKATALQASDLTADVDAILDEIVNGSDEAWQQYTDQLSREVSRGMNLGLFKTWSFSNRSYLAAQSRRRTPKAHGMYAGKNQWNELGRQVQEGATPFYIYGPPSYVRRVREEDPNAAPGAQPVVREVVVRRYRRPATIEVFDYSQTLSEDPDYIEPNWEAPLAGGNHHTLERLAKSSPVPVTFRDLSASGENGWLTRDGIVVDSSSPVTNQISTLAHELTHFHLGHLDRIADTRGTDAKTAERQRCEQEAALGQYTVMKMLGLDESVGANITEAAGLYLRHWFKDNADGTTTELAGHKSRRKLLKARFTQAFNAAQTITAAYAQQD